MNPEILLGDFERTDNTDDLHAIVGRALIVATRFDSMCKAAALHADINAAVLQGIGDETSFLLEQLAEKHNRKTLSASITALGQPKNTLALLTAANTARNAVAHDLGRGLTGCLDVKLDEESFVKEVTRLVYDIARGDIAISYILSDLNDAPVPRPEVISSYVEKLIKWVIER